MIGKFILSFIVSFVVTLLLVEATRAHYVPGRHNAIHAINLTWCGKSNVSCDAGRYALKIAVCESGPYWDWNRPTDARNGQYQGMFQMGHNERETYGHGPDPWRQARAAKRYWNISGWHPWECRLFV